jgi:hypothetical protein
MLKTLTITDCARCAGRPYNVAAICAECTTELAPAHALASIHSASCAAALVASDALRLALLTETDHTVIRQTNITLGALSALRNVTHKHCQH